MPIFYWLKIEGGGGGGGVEGFGVGKVNSITQHIQIV